MEKGKITKYGHYKFCFWISTGDFDFLQALALQDNRMKSLKDNGKFENK